MTTERTVGYFDGFAWAVPMAFSEPLAACRFEQGDILYDTRRAYEGKWGDALPHIRHSIQVKLPLRGPGTKTEKSEESVFADNWNMPVVLSLTDYKADTVEQITTTQGRLYSLLWKGGIGQIQPNVPTPPMPILAMDVLRELPKEEVLLRRNNLPEIAQSNSVFLIPFDRTLQLLVSKNQKVEKTLFRFKPHKFHFTPDQLGLQSEKEFAPTIRVACFALETGEIHEIEGALKRVLYTPSKDKKTNKESFRLSAHGHLFMNG